MKETGKKFLAPAFIIVVLQLFSVLFGFHQGLMFLVAMFVSVSYFVYRDFIDTKAALLGAVVFFSSTIVASVLGRLMAYENLCQGAGDVGGALCEGYFEWWLSFFRIDFSVNWPWWALFTGLAIISMIIYRRYKG